MNRILTFLTLLQYDRSLMNRSTIILILLACLADVAVSHAAEAKKKSLDLSRLPPAATTAVDYAKDIQPLFSKHCYSCHGDEKQRGGLRLDLKAPALDGGGNGKVILPGKSAESSLIQLAAGLDPENMMPPRGEKLTTADISKLRAWIDAGAVWPEEKNVKAVNHWAFKAPVRPEVPKLRNSQFTIRNSIDAFILARLEKEKLKPSAEADRYTLIRRLSLDLLGLPPALEEVNAFARDKRPDAYEQLVDRLLASPHFGERWGRHWLDLARYADSDGYEKDTARPFAYLFRDWVIEAINNDVPFDKFTIEQLAGDLLPGATEKQKQATGFHRQTLTNKEGGVDQEEFRCKATVDRASTTSTVWLGLTVGCAECHNHKYDPLTQREFYQFYAFFNNASEKDIPAPRPAELAMYDAEKQTWNVESAKLKTALETYMKNELPAKLAAWEKSGAVPQTAWSELALKTVEGKSGTALRLQNDGSALATGQAPDKDTYVVEVEPGELKGMTGFRLEVLPGAGKKPAVGRSKTSNFVLTGFSVKAQSGDVTEAKEVPLAKAAADFTQQGFDPAGALDHDDKTGWAVSPQSAQPHVAVFEAKAPVDNAVGTKLIFTLDQQYGGAHTIARFRLAATTSKPPLKPDMAADTAIAALKVPAEQRDAKQTEALAKYFSEQVDPGAKTLNEQLAAHAKKEPKFPETKAAILVEEVDKPRKTQIHIRGDFLRKGDEVHPGTFGVLNKFKSRSDYPDRLDLARWLVSKDNPLTARVTVNHVWKNLFGRALVPTVNDFGTRGEKPSHAELLDWLAIEFMGSGVSGLGSGAPPQTPNAKPNPPSSWSRKALIKLIVTSATYRRSSRLRPDLEGRDPSNVLLARQNRFRLEAENVRDIYLAASGLLNPAIGGPSIRPPLPADIAALGYANSVKWKESDGAEKYRRGLYIFFQRTVPYPMLMTFDSPDSNVTCTRRERSNTPLQALTLLNDPVFFECAQALGNRLAGAPGATDEKIRRAFQLCLGRLPTKDEMKRLTELYYGQMVMLKDKRENAARIAGEKEAKVQDVQEKATLVALSRVIMNLDEFVTRD